MIVQDYYNAWKEDDMDTATRLLDQSLFGVRTYHEDVLFTTEDVIAYLQKNPIVGCIVKDIQQTSFGYVYRVDIEEQNKMLSITAKMRITDGNITKIYETITTDTNRIKCVCSYDGSSFYGYQKQPHQVTVQGTIEHAVTEALSLDHVVSIHGSGRTDKGVHAEMQVFHFDVKTSIPIDKIAQLINNHLPDSIHIKDATLVEETFHSRYDIVTKEYMYIINHKEYNPIMRQYEWFVGNLNHARFKKELQEVRGTHDFQSFTKATNDSTIRTITNLRMEEDETHTIVYLQGTGFLRYMVRYIIGAAVALSTNKLDASMKDLLEEKDVTMLKDMAPASGLYLHHVEYE